jgi:hypothetical protein
MKRRRPRKRGRIAPHWGRAGRTKQLRPAITFSEPPMTALVKSGSAGYVRGTRLDLPAPDMPTMGSRVA